MKMTKNQGFTLIEILVVIGIIAILAAVVLIAINPARQFAQANNSQRSSNVNSLLNAVGQRLSDNKGVFTGTGCTTDIPTVETKIASGAYNLGACIVPVYMSKMPTDPKGGTILGSPCTPSWVSDSNYDTCYTIIRDSGTSRITVKAPAAELSQTIEVTR